MTCTCPKCKAAIELDIATIPVEGSFDKCSACNANLLIRKESFAKRAIYKSTEISCAECGNSPGTAIYCEHCHAIYPEILVIETSSAAKKQLGRIIASFNLLKTKTTATPDDEYVSGRAPSGKSSGAKLPGQPVQLAVIFAIIIAVAAGGGYYWYQNKIVTQYSQQYVRAILMLKSARDGEIKISSRVAANWKAGATVTLPEEDLKAIASAKKDAEILIKGIEKVPAKFIASKEALNKLYSSYGKLTEAITATSGTSELYVGAVNKMDDEFMKSARELKSGLPEKIASVLSVSTKKYKALQDF